MNDAAVHSRATLEVHGLTIRYQTPRGLVSAVTDVDLRVRPGETVALVGESGSGKSATALAITGLLPPNGRVIRGQVQFDGVDLLQSSARYRRTIIGRRIAIVFQNPSSSLNPVRTIGDQLTEGMRRHLGLDRRSADARALSLLHQVEISEPARRLRQFPHELSGGMNQRVMIAMALSCDPELLIADEPTTALDVTVQAQIIGLMERLKLERSLGVLWITHNLGVVSWVADVVAVMYAGRIVESGPVNEIVGTAQRHPYTRALLAAAPRLGTGKSRLAAIEGSLPDMTRPPTGCAYRDRCPLAIDRCRELPLLEPISPGHEVACWRA